VAQVLEYLSSKCESLNSNTSNPPLPKKIAKAKRARNEAQVVECLPGKDKTPSSKPNIALPPKKYPILMGEV
jgi:hypothetical protein